MVIAFNNVPGLVDYAHEIDSGRAESIAEGFLSLVGEPLPAPLTRIIKIIE